MPDTMTVPRKSLVPLERRQQFRARLERLERVKELLDAETIETDLLYESWMDSDGPRALEGMPGSEPVVIYWAVVDRWVAAAIDEARAQLADAERDR